MRHIKKQGTGSYHLSQAHSIPPMRPADATSRWHSYGRQDSGNRGRQLLDDLLVEQYFLCCYSELRADQLGLGYHNEHVEPKSRNPQRTFDWFNLAASALDSKNDLKDFAHQKMESFGGAFKLSEYDPVLFVSCHQIDCFRYFAYLSDGWVEPKIDLDQQSRRKAEYTIKTLNLNCQYLVNLRQQWWDELDGLYFDHLSSDWSIEDLAAIDLVPSSGKLSRFFTLTRQFFGPVAEQVLQQYAPDLI